MPTIEEKKAFLRQYQHSKRVQASLEDEIATLQASVMISANAMDGMPHGSSKSDLSGYAAKLDEMERELIAEIEHGCAMRRTILDAIEMLPNESEKIVLRFRYINGYKWEEIAEKTYYSYMHVNRIHGSALEHLEIPEQ